MEEKLRIAVLFGGCSPEYGVSLQSASAVIDHLDDRKYAPVLIGISPEGDWFKFDGDPERIATDTWRDPACCTPVAVSPDRTSHALLVLRESGVEKIALDAAFPVLHGKNGEDGTVQGVFELAGIPLVGCGVLASALCMDKARAHRLAQAAGIEVPRSFVLKKNMDAAVALEETESLGYPLFVKPVKAGSSYGVSKVERRDDFLAAVKLAFSYDDEVVAEECISGFEVGCAVMGNDTLTVGELDEIELSGGFFDFTEKYTLKTSTIHVPARITRDKATEIKRTAEQIYQALGCRGFARVDLFLDKNGRVVFNEVNTIPGFTAHSRFPSMMRAAGLSFGQVVSTVIELAVGE